MMITLVRAAIALGLALVAWQLLGLVRRLLRRRQMLLAARIIRVLEVAALWYGIGGAVVALLPEIEWLSSVWRERVAITVGTLITALTATRIVREALSASINKDRASPLAATFMRSIAYAAIYIIALAIVLATLGVNISAMVAAIGAGGLIVGLALQETLTNFFAGLYILLTGKFKVGDYVQFDTYEGTVEDITWRTTMLRPGTRAIIVVPNQRIASSVLTVYRAIESPIFFRLEFLLDPSADFVRAEASLADTHRALLESGNVRGLVDEPLLVRYGDSSSLGIRLMVWVAVENINLLWEARAVVMRTFLEALRRANIPLVILRQ
ncbi:MAG: hypothetical protein AA908_07845 [Chlorobi bacterium NICIL-2]|nr:MAG: hypothetical protein AA908_07845 [Chlorobi bacterium NICIL-2]